MRGLDFLENILPEGPALERMAVLAGVAGGHLRHPGGLRPRLRGGDYQMVLPDEDRPGGAMPTGTPRSRLVIERVISALDTTPLAAAPERGFRPSLAGFQRKALVGRADDGTWQLPSGDAPSTWILKPDGPHAIAANEATCLWLAAACGLPVPEAELLDVAGIPVLAVKRYDRQDAPAGDIPARVHQEDGCQATTMPPRLKYEEQGGPALRDFVSVIRNFGDPRDVTGLLRRTTFNMAVGNADAHAKNFSILHDAGSSAVRLAPLYDVLSTVALELTNSAGQPMRADTHLGQRVGGQADIRNVTAASLIDEAATWGSAAHGFGGGYRDNGPSAAAIPATPGDARVLAVIREQAERISRG